MKGKIILLTIFIWAALSSYSQDKNFYIFLSFGQSNMEGNALVRCEDTVNVDSRFKVMEAVDCPNLNRTKGQWYTAIPPLCRCHTGLTLTDFFGRTMIANLPKDITVGIINVSVGGCKIELFDKDNYQAYIPTVPEWLSKMIDEYDGNPCGRLVEMAKLAQKEGVIKGILLHQGESNTNDTLWPKKVKVVYDNLLSDLNLSAVSVPLLAGELVHADQGGKCASMNAIINQLPNIVPTAYVVSSSGCTDAPDDLHFNATGYREIGKRYASVMLNILGYTIKKK